MTDADDLFIWKNCVVSPAHSQDDVGGVANKFAGRFLHNVGKLFQFSLLHSVDCSECVRSLSPRVLIVREKLRSRQRPPEVKALRLIVSNGHKAAKFVETAQASNSNLERNAATKEKSIIRGVGLLIIFGFTQFSGHRLNFTFIISSPTDTVAYTVHVPLTSSLCSPISIPLLRSIDHDADGNYPPSLPISFNPNEIHRQAISHSSVFCHSVVGWLLASPPYTYPHTCAQTQSNNTQE